MQNQLIEDFLRMPRQLPPHLSDLLRRLGDTGRLFIEQYDSKKERMQAIARELMGTSKAVKKMEKKVDKTVVLGTCLGVLGMAIGIGAALETGAEKVAILVGLAAFGVGTAAFTGAVVTAHETQTTTETKCVKTVEELGKEFMDIIELHKGILIDIMMLLQQVLQQTAELPERSRVMDVTLAMQSQVRELLNFVVSVAVIIKTPVLVAELKGCITDSALQCEKTVHEFTKMRKTLKDFEEMQTE